MSYGMLRYLLPFFPAASALFYPFIVVLCIIAILYSSLACLAQNDLKKIIAYSSVAHMNTATIAIFTNVYLGISSSIYFLISHGIISSALFLLIGVLYDRYHTRTINYYRGLVSIMPIFTTIFLIFSLANSAVPGTSGFISEFVTFIGIFSSNPFIAFFASFAIILTPAYSLWFFHKVSYGTFSNYLPTLFQDLTYKEFHLFLPLLFFTFFLGLYPQYLFEFILLPSVSLLSSVPISVLFFVPLTRNTKFNSFLKLIPSNRYIAEGPIIAGTKMVTTVYTVSSFNPLMLLLTFGGLMLCIGGVLFVASQSYYIYELSVSVTNDLSWTKVTVNGLSALVHHLLHHYPDIFASYTNLGQELAFTLSHTHFFEMLGDRNVLLVSLNSYDSFDHVVTSSTMNNELLELYSNDRYILTIPLV